MDMNFINEHMNILILIGIGVLIIIYLYNNYIRNYIDNEILILKKKIKGLQTMIYQLTPYNNRLKLPQDVQDVRDVQDVQDVQDVNNNSNYHNMNSDIDADSYFDPTKH